MRRDKEASEEESVKTVTQIGGGGNNEDISASRMDADVPLSKRI